MLVGLCFRMHVLAASPRPRCRAAWVRVACVKALEWMSSYGLCLQRLCGCVFCRLLPVRTVMVEGGDAGVRAWLQDRLKKNREHFVKTHTYPNGLRLRCHMLVTRHVLYSLPV